MTNSTSSRRVTMFTDERIAACVWREYGTHPFSISDQSNFAAAKVSSL